MICSSRTDHPQLSLKNKSILIISGILFSFILLEVALRAGRFILPLLQELNSLRASCKKAPKYNTQAGYEEYFVDMFAGDFGHCTPKGNRLLAENTANVIIRGYFKK